MFIVIYRISLSIIVRSDRSSSPVGRFVCFRLISKETAYIPTTRWNLEPLWQSSFRKRNYSLAEACLSLILGQVSTNAVRRKRPLCQRTTADTTAELGFNPQQSVTDCLCRLIHPAADRGSAVPALPGPCCHHGAQVGSLPNSLDGFPAVSPNGFSFVL